MKPELIQPGIKKNSYQILTGDRTTLTFMCGERRLRVSLDRITHISTGEGETIIHTLGKKYSTGYYLTDIFSHLPPTQFYRIHPLHIVALRHIREVDNKDVLIEGYRLFTTHLYRAQLCEALERRRQYN
jgi:DNA-binding LytR/AlgR family response regulator